MTTYSQAKCIVLELLTQSKGVGELLFDMETIKPFLDDEDVVLAAANNDSI